MLLIQETWVNRTRGYHMGQSDYYEPFTDNLGRLFKFMQQEYGRCVSKVYVDTPDGTPDAIGWVFEKLAKYQDCNETYLQETWVTYKWRK